MQKCGKEFKIPNELMGEDVYDTLYLFDSEQEAIAYVSKEYKIDMEKFSEELHEEDFMREDYGKENYLRGAKVKGAIYLRELIDGKYILWVAY